MAQQAITQGAIRYDINVLYTGSHTNLEQEHLRAQWLLHREPHPAMRADQDYGAQGGRYEPSAKIPCGPERCQEFHSDNDRNQYVHECEACKYD